MLATVLGRMYERSYGPLETTGNHAFTDVNYSSWYGDYVDWSYQNGIIQGVGGGRFEPDRTVTRQELAAMLYRFTQFLKLSGPEAGSGQLGYTDSDLIAAWAAEAALYTQETGIITGRSGGTFAPRATATRAEVAAVLRRLIEYTL